MLGWILIATIPTGPVIQDRVDVIELNHFYDDYGQHVFDQLIFWDFNWRRSRMEVRAWRMVKKKHQLPRIDHGREDVFSLWSDGEVMREVRAPILRESWEQYDPELVNREMVPKERRRELTPREGFP